ncbi:hypothetical protein VSP20_12550 [Myroides phaeus]|uniref:hypothetical protein n=1 Tax=Myroides phaeus TaxID=702745 RepID=UPI002DB59EFE|nr:hypothetical protein [Myroides phaeus]MEC4117790.1 hypothetical protein [Myroides phaeus]
MEEIQELPEVGGFGSDGLHNILILLIILIIIGLQVKVFLDVKKKISSYKTVLPETKSFKTEKIYLTEKEISTLTLESIYQNSGVYKSREGQSVVTLNSEYLVEEDLDEGNLYFNAPLGGEFLAENSKSKAVYKLYNIWDGTADFSLIVSEDKIPTYIFNSALYIESGCNVENEYSADFKKIKEVKPGVAILKDGIWVLVEKSVIRFVS